MASNPEDPKQSGGFFASMASTLTNLGSAMTKSVNGIMGYEGLEVINPDGSHEDLEDEARKGRWKQEDRDSYWKIMQKYIGSDVTSLVTLPVLIFEPMTMLQKMAELMEYSHLLDLADECEDPYMRSVYVASFFISVYFAYQRTWKPFNPILGETYEMVNHGGVTFLSEQISHHPPMSAAHAENEHFIYDITSKVKTKFLGNSVDIYPVGRTHLTLKRDGVEFELAPPPTKVNNLIFGRTWIDSPGDMVLTNLTTGDKVVLYFQPCGWFGSGRYEVDGYVYSSAEEPKILMTGKWNESMSYQRCDAEGEPLPGTELKEVWRVADVPQNDSFQYTRFAHKINSFDSAPKKLLASDSRLRPDRYALEQGDLSKAGFEKSRSRSIFNSLSLSLSLSLSHTHTHTLTKYSTEGITDIHSKLDACFDCTILHRFRNTNPNEETDILNTSTCSLTSLEERQRAEKKNRQEKGHEFTPRWFDKTDEVFKTTWDDMEVYRYNGKYTEHRAAIDNSDSVEAIDIKSIEFNPWQYEDLAAA